MERKAFSYCTGYFERLIHSHLLRGSGGIAQSCIGVKLSLCWIMSGDETFQATAFDMQPQDDLLTSYLSLKERALSAVAEGITISDNRLPDNPIVYANGGFEKLTGYQIEEVLNKNCRFLQGPDTNPEKVDEIRRAVREQRECTVELLNYRKDGTPFWNRLSITPVRDDEGNVTNYIGIQSDITKRKDAEDALVTTARQLKTAYRRMKGDLEEARELQLAMLPKAIPELPYLDIAVSMKTAQEVGGDYYDFAVDLQDTLTVAIGDATGHGLKAGTIVTATKVLFNSLVFHQSPVKILQEMSLALKDMGFHNMYMAMIIAKVTRDRMVISSAGMPFTLHYLASNKKVAEIELKGMPLGGFPEYPYQLNEIKLHPGDAFLLMSDGLMELRNDSGEFFGDERIKFLFLDLALESPEEIIRQLTRAAKEWRGDDSVQDDMTLMVMKVK